MLTYIQVCRNSYNEEETYEEHQKEIGKSLAGVLEQNKSLGRVLVHRSLLLRA